MGFLNQARLDQTSSYFTVASSPWDHPRYHVDMRKRVHKAQLMVAIVEENHSDLYPDEPRLSNEPETQRSEAKARGFTSKSIFLICFEILFPIMALFKDVASSETRESCDCELVELCMSPTKKIRCSPNPEHLKM